MAYWAVDWDRIHKTPNLLIKVYMCIAYMDVCMYVCMDGWMRDVELIKEIRIERNLRWRKWKSFSLRITLFGLVPSVSM